MKTYFFITARILIVVEEHVSFQIVNLVGPPTQGKALVGIPFNAGFIAQFWELYVLSEYFINLSERAETQLTNTALNYFTLNKTGVELD